MIVRCTIAILVIMSSYLSGMERYTIKVETEENKINLSLVESNPTQVTLDGCVFCKEQGTQDSCNFCKYESTTFCGQCEGIYYCSPGCKYAHKDKHQEDCRKLVQAQYGDLDSIESFIQGNVEQLKKTKKEKYFKALLKWYSRKAVRVLVDCACSTDPKLQDKAYMNTKLVSQDHLKLLLELNVLTQNKQKMAILDDIIKHYTEAVQWVQDLINKDKLVSPHGVLRYSDYYLKESVGNEEPIILESEWKSHRLQALTEDNKQVEALIAFHEKFKQQNNDTSDSKEEEKGAPQAIA